MQARNMGKPIPEDIQNKPTPMPGSELFLQAFYDLDGERHLGMGVGRIPWSAVQHYATVYGMWEDQTNALHYLIGRMDASKLQKIADSMKKKD